MKIVIKLCLLILVFGLTSCRDTKKEEAETNAAIEKIEAVEAESDSITEKLEQEANELEAALEELDSI